jgi:hypothetical protein
MTNFGLVEINETINKMKLDIKEISEHIANDEEPDMTQLKYIEGLITAISLLKLLKKQLEK